jgi:hypothetical protein
MQDTMRYEREHDQSYEGEHDQEVEEHLLFSDTPESYGDGPELSSGPPGALDAEEEQRLLSHTLRPHDDDREFSPEPMPAAFIACLFLAAAFGIVLSLAILATFTS